MNFVLKIVSVAFFSINFENIKIFMNKSSGECESPLPKGLLKTDLF